MQPTTAEIVHVPRGGDVTMADFKPIFSVTDAIERKRQIGQIISGVLNEGSDYGKLPGGRETKVLLKPGAEKLASMFGLTPRYVAEQEIEDWTGKDHGGESLFYYKYRCQLFRGERLLGEAIGSCSSWESKYRFRWITAEECAARGIETASLPSRGGVQTITEPEFAITKGQTDGKYGKPAEYWDRLRAAIKDGTAKAGEKPGGRDGVMKTWSIQVDAKLFRVSNPDIADVVNTVQKMAQKRAFVAVVLVATNASDSFTQDLEDFSDGIDTGGHPAGTQAAADYVRDQKLEKQSSPEAGTSDPADAKGAVPRPPLPPEHEGLTLIYAAMAKGKQQREEAITALCDAVRGVVGDDTTDQLWMDATKKHGDPMANLGNARNVAKYLFDAMEREKESQRAA